MDQLFLSYSRNEMYFAEAVALGLRQRGFDVWFDLQQLSPGSIWQNGITEALNRSNALILIVSSNSVQSRWVALECLHALEEEKPIYLMVLEPVKIEDICIDDEWGERIQFSLSSLEQRATSIVDARRNFEEALSELASALEVPPLIKSALPKPTFLGLPTRMPWSVALVLVSMTVMTILSFYLVVFELTNDIGLFFLGIFATAFLGRHTYFFVKRRNFNGTRIALLIGTIVSMFFFPQVSILLFVASIFAFASPDVHRWSPRSEGIMPIRLNYRVVNNILTFDYRGAIVSYLLTTIRIALSGFVWFIAPILTLQLASYLEPSPPRNITVSPYEFVLFLFAIYVFWIICYPPYVGALIRRFRKSPSGLRYRLWYRLWDSRIANQIDDVMQSEGLEKTDNEDESTYTLVILSGGYGASFTFSPRSRDEKIIAILTSNLTDPNEFKSLDSYQWFDYRTQNLPSMRLLANHLADGNMMDGLSLRTTPTNFTDIQLPRKVIAYLVPLSTQLPIILSLTGNVVSVSIALLLAVPTYIYIVWLFARVARRDISIQGIVFSSIVANVIQTFLTTGLMYLAYTHQLGFGGPQAWQYAIARADLIKHIPTSLSAIVLSTAFIWIWAQYLLRTWLPVFSARMTKSPRYKRDWKLWLYAVRIMSIVIVTFLLLVSPSAPFRELLLNNQDKGVGNELVVKGLDWILNFEFPKLLSR